MNIIDAIRDPNLFAPYFGGVDQLESWKPWLTALRVLYGIPVSSKFGRDLIRQCTGRDPDKLPKDGFQTALFICGRRSGKSRISACIGAYAAALSGAESRLAAGETGLVAICAPTRRQGQIVRGYLRAIFGDDAPMLKAEVVSEQKSHDFFQLRNCNRIETIAGDFRFVRGHTLLSAVVDEQCFFGLSDEGKVRSDTELVRALQPALATCNGRLVLIGSPYARRGWSYQQWKKHWGNDKSNVLVWQAASRTMNTTLPQAVVDAALAEDYAAARSEYLAEWRDDISQFLPAELIENLVVKGRMENLPGRGMSYRAFADLSGGRNDAAALAIGHKERRTTVLDALRVYRAPHNPHAVIAEMADVLKQWRIGRVTGDNYAADFAAGAFLSQGIMYRKSEKNKSQLYAELLPTISSGEIELLDHKLLVDQLCALERRTRSGGKDIIDHPPGSHDDAANAVAGAAVQCSSKLVSAGAAGF